MSLISRFRKLGNEELASVPADTNRTLPSFFIHLEEMMSFEALTKDDWAVILKDLIELEVTLLDAAVRLRLLSQSAFGSSQFQRAFLVCAISLRIGPKRQEWDKYGSQDIIIKARQALEDFQTALGHVYKNQKTIVNIVMTAYPDVCLCLLARYRWGPSTFSNPTSPCVLIKFIFSHNFLRVLDSVDEKLMRNIRKNYQYFHDLLKKREDEIKAKKPDFPGFLLKDTEEAISSVQNKAIPNAIIACAKIINDCLEEVENDEIKYFIFKKNADEIVAKLDDEARPDVNTDLQYPKTKKSAIESKAALLKKKKQIELDAIENNKLSRKVKRENRSLIDDAIKAKKENISRMSTKELDTMLGITIKKEKKEIEDEEDETEDLAGVTPEEKRGTRKSLTSLINKPLSSSQSAPGKAKHEVDEEEGFDEESEFKMEEVPKQPPKKKKDQSS